MIRHGLLLFLIATTAHAQQTNTSRITPETATKTEQQLTVERMFSPTTQRILCFTNLLCGITSGICDLQDLTSKKEMTPKELILRTSVSVALTYLGIKLATETPMIIKKRGPQALTLEEQYEAIFKQKVRKNEANN